jgi:acetyl esterase/lipase
MADTGIKPTKTVTYKVVAKLEILLDVYLPKDTKKAPIILWFHGGGLLHVPSPTIRLFTS